MPRAGRRQPHQLRIAGGPAAVGAVEIVLESDAGVSALSQGPVHAGQLPLSEGAQEPPLSKGADFQQRVQVTGFRLLIGSIAAQHKEDAGVGMGNDTTMNELDQEPDLIGIENDELGKDPFRLQPLQEFRRLSFKVGSEKISPMERLTASGLSSRTRPICCSGR